MIFGSGRSLNVGRRKLAGIEISPLVGHSDEQVNCVTCSRRGEDLQRDEIGPASIVDPIRLIGHPAKPRSLLEARCLRRRTDFSHADNVCSKDQPLAVAQLLCFIRPAEERYRLFGGIPRVKLRLRLTSPSTGSQASQGCGAYDDDGFCVAIDFVASMPGSKSEYSGARPAKRARFIPALTNSSICAGTRCRRPRSRLSACEAAAA